MSTTPGHTVWVKSSYSGDGGYNCLEWAPAYINTGTVPVRDSKDPHGPALTFPTSAWASFITAVQQDTLDSV
ncbi:DUF397 domain-containing protein [Streptomyces oryzae]|uniref:DUF397 domain-containing protein n=1 Tax=Streptomyces oryzae TaxID=1434886 RepID=A0ABS3XJY7_9ACTN|nr:DUF397 domain-containing protein [Streptomyces oryzae]MBO8195624.1 DUF397 domain-containing protein [Streptomyces oryzae]